MNKNISIGIIIVVAAIAVGVAYFVGKKSNNVTQPTNTPQTLSATQTPVAMTQTQPPVVSNTSPNPQKNLGDPTSNIDESKACANQALVLSNRFQSQNSSLGAPGGGFWNYESHYNVSQGKCFFYRSSTSPYNGDSVLDEELYDAYDNTIVASYNDETSPANVTVSEQCNINGVWGCTNKQFRAFLNTEMESTMY